jgi:phosphoglycolate phosphatase-like HAD superfamily hydrolase
MKLFVFDIDGTLARTNSVDSDCYKKAVISLLGDVRFRDTWSDYVNVTDEGILLEIVADNKIEINKGIKNSIKEEFLKLLKIEFNRKKPEEIPGGIEFLENLSRLNIALSFATGCWRDSALLKLKETGYNINSSLVSSSDNSIKRKQIMLNSLEKAKKYYKIKNIEKIYYFGDGFHDFKACEKLGWNFIGIGEKVKELCKFNRCKWLYNYLDSSISEELFSSV